jgi:hypothetical protein
VSIAAHILWKEMLSDARIDAGAYAEPEKPILNFYRSGASAQLRYIRQFAVAVDTVCPISESNARKCDMRTTPLMNRAHGTYVRLSIVDATNSTYLLVKTARNGKRLGVVEPD